MSRTRVVLIFILALTLASPLAAGAQEYRIGFISAITGPASSLGVPERDVAVMIQKELEAKGGITGPDGKKYPVKLFIHDDESKADTTVRLVKKLIAEENEDADPEDLEVFEARLKELQALLNSDNWLQA